VIHRNNPVVLQIGRRRENRLRHRSPSRQLEFEAILNFRDLGGYTVDGGRQVAWRRVFRSGGLWDATPADWLRLRKEVGVRSVLDLRDKAEIDRRGCGQTKASLSYINVPLSTDSGNIGAVELVRALGDTGKVYLLNMKDTGFGRRLVECLRVIAEADHPLVFHCSAGKDRTGVLAACLLSVLGVDSEHIVGDYTLTGPYMARHIERLSRDPEDARFLQSLPTFMHESSAASMALFLSTMKQDYGSIQDYLLTHGADGSLFGRLEQALLVPRRGP
jgi:protein-tyrosine phosphatase